MEPAIDQILAAVANPTRRAILDRLIAGEATVGDLAAPFALSQPTISAHLKILEAAGLVTRGQRANQRPVRLQPAALGELERWIGQYRRLWNDRFDQIEDIARELERKDQHDDS